MPSSRLCFGLVAQATLGEALGDLLDGLVVLAVAVVGEADPDVLGTGRGGLGLLLDLRQRGLVGGRGLLDGLEQARVAVLGALLGEHVGGEALLQHLLRLARGAGLERQLRHLVVVARALEHVDFRHQAVGLQRVGIVPGSLLLQR